MKLDDVKTDLRVRGIEPDANARIARARGPRTDSHRHAAGTPTMKNKMALRRFALRAASGYGGSSAAVDFARDLVGCFGGAVVAGGAADTAGSSDLVYGHSFSTVTDGKRTKRTVAAYWPSRRVLVDVVDRQAPLDTAWKDLLHACLQMDGEAQYVVLSNQRDLHLYDLARDRSAPRLSIAIDELPKYSEAFVFFEPDWVPGTTPKIINVDKVSKEVADLVAKVYRALRKAHGAKRTDEVIRFTLQCIVAMFAEDIGLLPKEYFTTLLYRGAEEGDVEKRLKKLFAAMSSKKGGKDGIPYFNGGLFREPVTLPLDEAPLRALIKAAESNWKYVDPHIFGSVFQGIMDDAERHASGAHYTAREDIMSVVGPTIVEPWRARIAAASTMTQLREILKELGAYRVLDPACGSGNFLYVAFRELYRLETEVLHRMHEFPSAKKGKDHVGWDSRIRTTNFFGLDINPFAVELAKTTLNIAKKIAFDERRAMVADLYGQGVLDVDPSLPLDNLDDNIRCADALFTEWDEADAIIGNPPFLGDRKIRSELGAKYIARLRESTGVDGLVNLCCYWFRRAHDFLPTGGRAGLVATSGIRIGKARETALDYIVDGGGAITNAVSSRPWPGDAAVDVSIINWIKGTTASATLTVGNATVARKSIAPHLENYADVRRAKPITANNAGTSMGVIFGLDAFRIDASALRTVRDSSYLRPIAAGTALLTGRLSESPHMALNAGSCRTEIELRADAPALQYLRAHVKSAVMAKADKYPGWPDRWWQPLRPQVEFFEPLSKSRRMIACSSPQARPIFEFLSTRFVPTNTLQVFAFEDDYAFGVIQSLLHWRWTCVKGGRVRQDIRYTSEVWKTFPWPQAPTEHEVVLVARAARELRATRRRLMDENGWSLRDLYQAAEVAGPHPLRDAQAALDAAVEAAYGKPADQEATEFLLEMNLALAEDEAAGETIQGPGLPAGYDPKDPHWFSTDCIEPPPLELDEDDDG